MKKMIVIIGMLCTYALQCKAEPTMTWLSSRVFIGLMLSEKGHWSVGLEEAYSSKKSSYVQGIDISGCLRFVKASSNVQYSFRSGQEKPWDVRFLIGPSLGVLQFQVGYSTMQHNWVMRAQSSWYLLEFDKSLIKGYFGALSTSMFFEYQKQINSYVVGVNMLYVLD